MKEIKVIELFAGVGGFRIGLERVSPDFFRTIWANQWEPSTKVQHASMVYQARFGKDGFCERDINTVDIADIPNHDMLVGGFPCQDYSVASTLSKSRGIEGKKGVLWWAIYKILLEKGDSKPSILFLENVDRLLLSPASQRGRDFAIILECLNSLGYVVEWRVINAADYAMPQRRRRTYILAYQKNCQILKKISTPEVWVQSDGIFANAFPIVMCEDLILKKTILSNAKTNRLIDISSHFNVKHATAKPFETAGIMIDGVAYSTTPVSCMPNGYVKPMVDGKVYECISDVIAKGVDLKYVTDEFYISDSDIPKWKYFKGPKSEPRVDKKGYEYMYTEGGLKFPDDLSLPSRTIITSEGGKSPDRCRHVIEDQSGRLRRLIPLELERLNMFPDNHTLLEGVSNSKRAFLMGNALVCGVIEKVGREIYNRLK